MDVVYIIRPVGGNFFKVGHTGAIDARLNAYVTAYAAMDVVYIHHNHARQAEATILNLLADKGALRMHNNGKPSETAFVGDMDCYYNDAVEMLLSLLNQDLGSNVRDEGIPKIYRRRFDHLKCPDCGIVFQNSQAKYDHYRRNKCAKTV